MWTEITEPVQLQLIALAGLVIERIYGVIREHLRARQAQDNYKMLSQQLEETKTQLEAARRQLQENTQIGVMQLNETTKLTGSPPEEVVNGVSAIQERFQGLLPVHREATVEKANRG